MYNIVVTLLTINSVIVLQLDQVHERYVHEMDNINVILKIDIERFV